MWMGKVGSSRVPPTTVDVAAGGGQCWGCRTEALR
jgi:hypothetical protein